MLRVHDAGRNGKIEWLRFLTIYASFSPSLHFPRLAAVKKKTRLQQYRTYKKFLGISNTPEVFIVEAGHVNGARRQKFEITCSDVRILRHTCAALFLSPSQFLVLISSFSVYVFSPLLSLCLIHRRCSITLSAPPPSQNSGNGVCERVVFRAHMGALGGRT